MSARAEPSGPGGSKGRLAVLAGVIGLVVATAAVLGHLDGRYGPIGRGHFSGPLSLRGLDVDEDGFSFRLAPDPDTAASFIAALHNRGAHSVTVTSVDPPPEVSDVRWSVYRTVAGGNVAGVDTRWRRFPVTIGAHDVIRLRLTMRPPDCTRLRPGPGTTVTYDGSLLVSWRSLLRTHRTSESFFVAPVRIC